MKIDPELTVQIDTDDPTPMLGYPFAKQLLARKKPFTALFAYNDMSAIGAIRAIQEHGLRVPQDVSVMWVRRYPRGGVSYAEPDDGATAAAPDGRSGGAGPVGANRGEERVSFGDRDRAGAGCAGINGESVRGIVEPAFRYSSGRAQPATHALLSLRNDSTSAKALTLPRMPHSCRLGSRPCCSVRCCPCCRRDGR